MKIELKLSKNENLIFPKLREVSEVCTLLYLLFLMLSFGALLSILYKHNNRMSSWSVGGIIQMVKVAIAEYREMQKLSNFSHAKQNNKTILTAFEFNKSFDIPEKPHIYVSCRTKAPICYIKRLKFSFMLYFLVALGETRNIA